MNAISHKILCVDDEINVLHGFQRQLRKVFDISIAVGGEEALKLLDKEGEFAVVISDYNMPGMDGIDLLQRIHQDYPDTVLVMLTGRAELDVAVSALHDGGIFRFLRKPCPREILERTIADCLNQYRLIRSGKILSEELDRANGELRSLNQRLEEKVAERTETLRSQYEFVYQLNGLDSLTEVANLIVKSAAQLVQSREVSLFLSCDNDTCLDRIATTSKEPLHFKVPVDEGIVGQSFSHASSVILGQSDFANMNVEAKKRLALHQPPSACLPLIASGNVIGVLCVSGDPGVDYSPEQITKLKAISESAATALLNQRHRAERDEAQDAIIMALAKLSEYRDPETGEHLLRLKIYCRLICEALRNNLKYRDIVDEQFIDDLARSSPLHDIGKVGIPDAILKKPGRHTVEEFELMKTHASLGGDTLKAVLDQCKNQNFIKIGMEIAYGHHEKWDGSGYPQALAGDNIPLSARILALADVYDALTTPRVYKPAFPHDKARQIIVEGSGSHFDPDIVNAFLAAENQFIKTALELTDDSPELSPLEELCLER